MASGSKSRLKLESLVDRTNDSLVGEATPSSLAALRLMLQNQGPKSRWLSKVGEGHSLTKVNMHLCFQAGTNQQGSNVLPALTFTLYCFICPPIYSLKDYVPSSRHKPQTTEIRQSPAWVEPTPIGGSKLNHRTIKKN